jgi:hypothetical protein
MTDTISPARPLYDTASAALDQLQFFAQKRRLPRDTVRVFWLPAMERHWSGLRGFGKTWGHHRPGCQLTDNPGAMAAIALRMLMDEVLHLLRPQVGGGALTMRQAVNLLNLIASCRAALQEWAKVEEVLG